MSHEVLAAWSTFAAVVVALFIPVARAVWAWIRRPRLKIIVKPEEPHYINISEKNASLIRLQVQNKGSKAANNAWVRMGPYFYSSSSDPDPVDTEEDPFFWEPANLKWSGSGDQRYVTIPSKSEFFAELIEHSNSSNKPGDLEFKVSEEAKRKVTLRVEGKHRMELTYGAEGFTPRTKSFEFTISQGGTTDYNLECIKDIKETSKLGKCKEWIMRRK